MVRDGRMVNVFFYQGAFTPALPHRLGGWGWGSIVLTALAGPALWREAKELRFVTLKSNASGNYRVLLQN